jgi:hypothetical protein
LVAFCLVAATSLAPAQVAVAGTDSAPGPFETRSRITHDQAAVDAAGTSNHTSLRTARRVRWSSLFVHGLPAVGSVRLPFTTLSYVSVEPAERFQAGIRVTARQGRAPPRY